MYTTTRNAIAIATAFLAFAGSANAADEVIGHLTWNCNSPGAPTLQQVKALYNIQNNYLASLLLQPLVGRLRAQCMNGASTVQVALTPPPAAPEPVLVAATDPHAKANPDLAAH